MNSLQDQIIQLTFDINRMNCNSQVYDQIKSEIIHKNELKAEGLSSFPLRSCLRTIRRLTNGRCTQAIDVHMVMMVKSDKKRLDLTRNELSKLDCMTDTLVNKEKVISDYNQYIVQSESWVTEYEFMLSDNDYLKTERKRLNESIFNSVDTLTEEEVEMLDKITYDKKIHHDRCPVCLDERSENGEEIVSIKCSVFHNLCTSCAIELFKRNSRCPLCRAYV